MSLTDILTAVYNWLIATISKEGLLSIVFIAASFPLGLLLLWSLSRYFPDAMIEIQEKEMVAAWQIYLAMCVVALVLIYGSRIVLGMLKTTFMKTDS